MKEIKITECKMEEALTQIDAIVELGFKERGCLRLLAEELFSMCHELLGVYTLDFDVKQDGSLYTLSVATETQVREMERETLLSVSSNGKNAANKGVKGILGAVLELFFTERDPGFYSTSSLCGMHIPAGSYSFYTWTLSRYIAEIEANKGENKWDGLEKSIIANFADDVSIGVRSHKLEITITKTF